MTETTGSMTVMGLEEVIANHLEYNMQLAVTKEYADILVPSCIKALEEVNAYRLDTLIELPKGVSITWMDTGKTTNMCPAYAIVYRFQLTDWLKEDWDIEKYEKELEKEKNEIPNSE